jgi:Zn-dependent protease
VDEYVPSQPADRAAESAYHPPVPLPARPRLRLPVILFALTCASTFFAGGARTPNAHLGSYAITFDWTDGLAYMSAVMAILLAHEMGHFLQAVRYGVPASLPFFIPMPISFTGTMGAVIGMQGTQADRKQLFDIGLTGPWTGLAIALPLACYGISIAEPFEPPAGTVVLLDPPVIRWITAWLRPELPAEAILVANPYLTAAWFGVFFTGLNMVPVSQLDGGHTSYALFGPRGAHVVARLFVVSVIAMIIREQLYHFIAMLVLVMFIGIDHPPTRDDTVRLGLVRRVVGYASLALPIFCMNPSLAAEWR